METTYDRSRGEGHLHTHTLTLWRGLRVAVTPISDSLTVLQLCLGSESRRPQAQHLFPSLPCRVVRTCSLLSFSLPSSSLDQEALKIQPTATSNSGQCPNPNITAQWSQAICLYTSLLPHLREPQQGPTPQAPAAEGSASALPKPCGLLCISHFQAHEAHSTANTPGQLAHGRD